MIIIIEGIDRVGKTTLANKLSEQFNIPIYKQDRIGGNEIQLNMGGRNIGRLMNGSNFLMNYTRARTLVDFWNWSGFKQNIIMDRFHWTEAVYSYIERNNIEQLNNMKQLERLMLEHKEKYLIVQVMPVDIKFSSKQHGSDLSKHQIEFDKLYRECKLDKIRCSHFSYDTCISEVERRLKDGER